MIVVAFVAISITISSRGLGGGFGQSGWMWNLETTDAAVVIRR